MSLATFTHRPVHTIALSCTITEAAQRMCQHQVGALVIIDSQELSPLGVLTDRDIVAMIAEELNPQEATVAQFLRASLQTAAITDSFDDVLSKMRAHGVRRLPIVDANGHLCGMVTLDDILVLLGNEMADVAATITGEIDQESMLRRH
ncbi:MAG: CBS domain-containing protein [Candidatus Binatia bacterium]